MGIWEAFIEREVGRVLIKADTEEDFLDKFDEIISDPYKYQYYVSDCLDGEPLIGSVEEYPEEEFDDGWLIYGRDTESEASTVTRGSPVDLDQSEKE